MDTEQLSETLTKLNNSLDPKSVSTKSNSEVLLQLEVKKNVSFNITVIDGKVDAPGCGRSLRGTVDE